jgi:hypothetical protein
MIDRDAASVPTGMARHRRPPGFRAIAVKPIAKRVHSRLNGRIMAHVYSRA